MSDEFSAVEIDKFVRSFGTRPDEGPYPMNEGDQLFALRVLVHLSTELTATQEKLAAAERTVEALRLNLSAALKSTAPVRDDARDARSDGLRIQDARPVLEIAVTMAREARGDPIALDRNGHPLWLQFVGKALAAFNTQDKP